MPMSLSLGEDADRHAGVVFRVTSSGNDTNEYDGYYAGIQLSGEDILGEADGSGSTKLKSTQMDVSANMQYHVRVSAFLGSELSVCVNDMVAAKITVTDVTYTEGKNGVCVYGVEALFDNISAAEP